MKSIILLVVVLGALLAAALFMMVRGFSVIEAELTWPIWIAMGLGVSLTALIGGGLMFLMFYSARHGYDDIDHEL